MISESVGDKSNSADITVMDDWYGLVFGMGGYNKWSSKQLEMDDLIIGTVMVDWYG